MSVTDDFSKINSTENIYIYKIAMERTINACILAGGQSKRMGADKGLIKLGSKPMIEHITEVLEGIVSRIIINTNNPAYRKFGYPLLADEVKGAGPMGGLYTCLKYSVTRQNLVVACDFPYVNKGLIRHLLSEADDSYDIVVPSYQGRLQPLCAVYHKRMLPVVEKQLEIRNYKMMDLLDLCTTRIVNVVSAKSYYNTHLFKNINTASDFPDFD